jgi:hypothetical protein
MSAQTPSRHTATQWTADETVTNYRLGLPKTLNQCLMHEGELHGEVDLHDERVTRWLHRRPAWRPFDPDWVRKLKANVASDIAVAGPELAAQVIQAGLVDEFQMRVCPVVIGGGKRYFPSGMRPLHTFRFLRPARLRTPLLGYSAPHLSARGTSPPETTRCSARTSVSPTTHPEWMEAALF